MKKVEIDEILGPGDDPDYALREEKVRSGFWKKIKHTAAGIPFLEDAVTAYYCALDPQTPTRVRGILFAALAYFILPLDSIPDFLAGFGLTDDIAVLATALTAIRENMKPAHRIAAQKALEIEEESEPVS